MGRMMEFAEEEPTSSPSSISESLLFTTLCIVGLPVEVHIKDGSVYSGIFHTASFNKGYGVALKKARMIRKGTRDANVPCEGLIETLVVLPKDLVQVVAKGVMLPAETILNSFSSDNTEGSRHSDSSQCYENGATTDGEMNKEREVVLVRLQEDEDGQSHYFKSVKEAPEVNGSSPRSNGHYGEHKAIIKSNQVANGNAASPGIKLVNQFHDTHFPNEITRSQPITSELLDTVKPESDAAHDGLAVSAEIARQNPVVNRKTKDCKLNPGAKVFSPSFPNFRSTPPVMPTVPSIGYTPNSIPAVQVAVAQPEIGTRPILQRSSWPVKIFPYVNSTPTNPCHGFQYSQPIAGHIASRPPSIRHGAQYQPIQAVPPYMHLNSQNAMIGRPGQVVYVHSVTPDIIQGHAAPTQAQHPFLPSHSIHVAKHEGVLGGLALPVSASPPLMNNAAQPFEIPNHVQLSQPLFSSILPFPILSSNVPYAPKFP